MRSKEKRAADRVLATKMRLEGKSLAKIAEANGTSKEQARVDCQSVDSAKSSAGEPVVFKHTMKCSSCSHVWIPRQAVVYKCPKCQRYGCLKAGKPVRAKVKFGSFVIAE